MAIDYPLMAINESINPPAPASRGIRAVGLDTLRFSTIVGHAFSDQPSAAKLFTSPKRCVVSLHHPPDSRSVTLPKTYNFQIRFQGNKNQNNWSQGNSRMFCLWNFETFNLQIRVSSCPSTMEVFLGSQSAHRPDQLHCRMILNKNPVFIVACSFTEAQVSKIEEIREKCGFARGGVWGCFFGESLLDNWITFCWKQDKYCFSSVD